jgi:hypothetical protein
VLRLTLPALVSSLALWASVQAAPPGAALLPGNAKLHVSIPDVLKLEKAWKKTKVAQLFDDPKLKPFFDDLFKESTIQKLGVDWDDLASVARGEMSLAIIPALPGQTAHVMTLYTNGQKMPLLKLLAKVNASMKKQGYKVGKKNIGGFPVTTYTRVVQDKKARDQNLFHFVRDEMLVAANNEKAVADVLQRWDGKSSDRLDQRKPYQEVMARSKAQAKTPGDLFWFVEPIGLAEAERSTSRTVPRRGPDTLNILKEEGFTAFQGVGGYITVGQGEHDFVHYTAIYAPGPYQKSMRMLKTLPGDDFTPPDWAAGDVARFETLYVDLKNAFQYYGSLFDAVYGEGDAGTFDDILKGMRDDPNGPQIDVAKDIIGRLGRRVSVLVDTAKPIGPFSARSLVAVDTTDEKGLAQGIRRLMENDEDVKKRNIGDAVVWEMITQTKKKKKAKSAAKPKAPNSAVAVARGQLFLASDVQLLEKILTGATRKLANEADFQLVAKQLANLGAGKDCLHSFSRPDEDFQTVYELLRTGQLDKSNSIYAQLLLDLFGDNVRDLDGSKFPDYQNFRRYLGPGGAYCVQQPGGWFLIGCSLRKQ